MDKVYFRDDSIKESTFINPSMMDINSTICFMNDFTNRIIRKHCKGCKEPFCEGITTGPISDPINPYLYKIEAFCPKWTRNEE